MSKNSSILRAGRPSDPKAKSVTLSDFSRVQTTRINFELEKEYHTKLKILAAQQERSIKEILSECVITLLSK